MANCQSFHQRVSDLSRFSWDIPEKKVTILHWHDRMIGEGFLWSFRSFFGAPIRKNLKRYAEARPRAAHISFSPTSINVFLATRR